MAAIYTKNLDEYSGRSATQKRFEAFADATFVKSKLVLGSDIVNEIYRTGLYIIENTA